MPQEQESKPFVIGSPVDAGGTPPSSAPRVTRRVGAAPTAPSRAVSWILTAFVVLVIALAGGVLLVPSEGIAYGPLLLLQSAVPPWLTALVAVFALLQALPLVSAYRLASHAPLARSDIRRIRFLCEMPMYLGLVGSLMGVCVSQLVSGSLAAPLAYLTSILGVLLYLYGRTAIELAVSADDEIED